jgi:hypothetical protein
MGQARSPMTDFFIYCYFYGFCKGRKNFVSNPRYAKKLRAMCEFQVRNFLADSALCGTAESRLRAMPHSGSRDSALCRIAEVATPRYTA